MQKYLEYSKAFNADEYVQKWVSTTLKNYLEKNSPTQDEVEHIIDYLINEKKHISKMSYLDAKKNAEKWVKSLQKKGEHIKETKKDIEVVLDFKDGFKIVKLVGKNAYEREGYLMSHCVASYYGNSKEIYSLRDKDNMPHCTMEKDAQIKGKGNGDIHPKYISYVVAFLKKVGMTVGDNEMLHLGYVNIEKLLPDIDKTIEKHLYNGKYLPKDKKSEIKVDGKEKIDLDMLEIFPLIEDNGESIKVAFDIPLLVSMSVEWIKKNVSLAQKIKNKITDTKIESSGYSSQLAGGNYSKLAGGDSSKLAGGNYSKLAGGDSSKLAGGNYSKLAGGSYSQLAGGDSSKLAGGYSSKLDIGKHGIAVGDNQSQAKGKIGSLLVLIERKYKSNDEGFYEIKNHIAVMVDGKKVKEDTWYTLKEGKLIEV